MRYLDRERKVLTRRLKIQFFLFPSRQNIMVVSIKNDVPMSLAITGSSFPRSDIDLVTIVVSTDHNVSTPGDWAVAGCILRREWRDIVRRELGPQVVLVRSHWSESVQILCAYWLA